MAESPTPALPGGIEWLPALGGAHLLRAELGRGDPPTLILHTASGTEHRIAPGPEARFSRSTDYLVPPGLHWATAFLHWPDGTRTHLPPPPGERGELIALPTRREPPTPPPRLRAAGLAPARAASPTPSGAAPLAAAPAPSGPAAPAPTGPAAPAPSGPVAPAPDGLAPSAAAPAPKGPAPGAAPAPGGLAPGVAAPASSGFAPGAAAPAPTGLAAPAPDGLAPSAAAPAPGGPAPAPLHWTAPPADAAPVAPWAGFDAFVAAGEWRVSRAGLERELSQIAEAVVRARDSERAVAEAVLAVLAGTRADLQAVRAARAADAALLAALTGQLEAERNARAAAGDGDGARALREQLERASHEATVARAEASALRAELEAERAARALAEKALRRAITAAEPPRASLEEYASRQAEVAAAAARRPAAESGQLIAALDAAAVSLRAAAPEPTPPEVDAGAALKALGYTKQAPAAQTTISPSPWRLAAEPPVLPPAVAPARAPRPGLLRSLVALARQDSVAAGSLLAGLLPAQGALLDDVSYDLTIRGFGTFAVTVEDGAARAERIARRRPRREAAFHLAGDPLALAELLAGEQRRIRRFGRSAVKVHGRRKRLQALAPLPNADRTLADLVRAGARLEPALVYRALPFAVAPEWTRGHVFTVAQEIVEFGSRAWYITARDGVPLDVVEHVSGAAADATVTMSRAAFERLLRGEPAAEGDLPFVRGNRAAVAALKRWTELAAGARGVAPELPERQP